MWSLTERERKSMGIEPLPKSLYDAIGIAETLRAAGRDAGRARLRLLPAQQARGVGGVPRRRSPPSSATGCCPSCDLRRSPGAPSSRHRGGAHRAAAQRRADGRPGRGGAAGRLRRGLRRLAWDGDGSASRVRGAARRDRVPGPARLVVLFTALLGSSPAAAQVVSARLFGILAGVFAMLAGLPLLTTRLRPGARRSSGLLMLTCALLLEAGDPLAMSATAHRRRSSTRPTARPPPSAPGSPRPGPSSRSAAPYAGDDLPDPASYDGARRAGRVRWAPTTTPTTPWLAPGASERIRDARRRRRARAGHLPRPPARRGRARRRGRAQLRAARRSACSTPGLDCPRPHLDPLMSHGRHPAARRALARRRRHRRARRAPSCWPRPRAVEVQAARFAPTVWGVQLPPGGRRADLIRSWAEGDRERHLRPGHRPGRRPAPRSTPPATSSRPPGGRWRPGSSSWPTPSRDR